MAKIKFERSGGFAGVLLSSELDPEELPEEEAVQACKLIDEAKLFDQPKQIKSRNVTPDRFEYKLTIRDKGKRRTVVVGDQSTPANLKPLIDYLLERARQA